MALSSPHTKRHLNAADVGTKIYSSAHIFCSITCQLNNVYYDCEIYSQVYVTKNLGELS